MYALSMKPIDYMSEEELSVVPENVTVSPFVQTSKRKEKSLVDTPLQAYRWASMDGMIKTVPGANPQQFNKKRKFNPLLRGTDCWFCFDSPKVEKHLVAWFGNDVYLALPKVKIHFTFHFSFSFFFFIFFSRVH
jgi:hypothetical protein